jgi:phosphatidyl-myo-inositol dimannoside synthase
MLLLATEVWGSRGGVQRYMNLLAEILTEHTEKPTVLTLLDKGGDRSRQFGGVTVACSGRKWLFCTEAFRLGMSGLGRTTIVGHIALLPIAWLMLFTGLVERYIVVLHGIEAWCRLPWIYRIAVRSADVVVATTRYTAREFAFYNGLEKSVCAVIPLACAFRGYREVRPAPSSGLRLLTVGRLAAADSYKGIDTVLEAVARLRQRDIGIVLDVIGDGDDRFRLETLAKCLRIDGAVRFRGLVPDEQLERLFTQADVFVMPSQKEGFGLVFLEAMAAGLPCIGANHGGTPEVVTHGESGFLIEYGDVEQLVVYLLALLQSPALYIQMSATARHRATETLGREAMSRAWERVIERAPRTGAEGKEAPFLNRETVGTSKGK